MCKHAYLEKKINQLFIPGNIFGNIWLDTAMEYSCVEFVQKILFQNQFFRVAQRGEHLLSSGQAKFDSQTGQRC